MKSFWRGPIFLLICGLLSFACLELQAAGPPAITVAEDAEAPRPLDEKLVKQIKLDIQNLADDEKIADQAVAVLLTIGADALPQL